MAVNVQVNPQNLTGRKKAELEAAKAEEMKSAASRMAMVTAEAEAARDEVVDLSGADVTSVPSADGTTSVEVKVPKVTLRVNTTLEAVTIGHGTHYDFEVGQTYKVTQAVYDYLDDKGFVWH